MISMGQTCLSLVFTVWIVSIFHRFPLKPVPDCIRSVFLNSAASVFCLHQVTGEHHSDFETASDALKFVFTPVKGNGVSPEFANPKANKRETEKRDHRSSYGNAPSHCTETASIPYDVIEYVRFMARKERACQKECQIREDWMLLARVLDRMLFWIMFVGVVLEISIFMKLCISQ